MKDDFYGALVDGEAWAVRTQGRITEWIGPVVSEPVPVPPWLFVLYFLDDVMAEIAVTAYDYGCDLANDALASGDLSDSAVQDALSTFDAIAKRNAEELEGYGDVLLTVANGHAAWVRED